MEYLLRGFHYHPSLYQLLARVGSVPELQVQLRLSGTVAVHHGDALARETWAATRKYSRRGYRLAQAPGSVLPTPQDADFQPAQDYDCGAAHFGVLRFTATQLEWLFLNAGGHRRAQYRWTGADWQGQWLAP